MEIIHIVKQYGVGWAGNSERFFLVLSDRFESHHCNFDNLIGAQDMHTMNVGLMIITIVNTPRCENTRLVCTQRTTILC
jgi:hypothetical protein